MHLFMGELYIVVTHCPFLMMYLFYRQSMCPTLQPLMLALNQTYTHPQLDLWHESNPVQSSMPSIRPVPPRYKSGMLVDELIFKALSRA
jgi:hypothetical protein